MPKASPGLVNFNGGEVGALMSARVDFDKYASVCYRLRRFIPTVQGPAKRCPGTRHVLSARLGSRVWLQRFEFSFDVAYILEFGDSYVRFYTDRGVVLEGTKAITGITQPAGVVTSAGHGYADGDWLYMADIVGMTELNGRYVVVSDSAANTFRMKDFDGNYITTGGYTAYASGGTVARVYTLASPYALADLTNDEGACALSISQSGDVLYIGCDGYQPRTLSRSSSTSWAFATYDPSDGPFQAEPTAEKSFQLSAASGSGVTLTCTTSVFTSAHVDMLWRLEPTAITVKPWEVGKAILITNQRKSDGKVYEALNSATTGTSTPIHERGSEYDGDTGVNWQYKHPGYVVVRITAYTSATQVTCTIIGPGVAPSEIVGASSSCRYRIGAWGTAAGAEWPTKTAFWRERLWWGGRQTVWPSVAGDYASHAPDEQGEILADNAFDRVLSVGTQDRIRWMRPSGNALIVGTAGSEVAVREVTSTQALGPENCKPELQAAEGSREIGPVLVKDGILFVRVGGRRVVELRFDLQSDSWIPRDQNVLYPEVTKGGLIDMAYQRERDDVVWCVRADGMLLGLTYDREQNIYGWHVHPLGGTDTVVESVQVITGPDGDIEDVWLAVARTIDGVTKRHIEYIAAGFEEGDDIEGAVYLDASLEFDGAQAVTLTPGTGATLAGTEGVVFTAGSAVFASTDVGREIRVRYYDEDAELWRTSRAEITGYTSSTEVEATILSAFTSTAVIASGGWRLTSTEVRGLWHLEGETVTALADGQEVPDLVVTDGVVTLPTATGRAQVGLPYTSTLATQRIEAGARDGTAQGKTKRIARMVIRAIASLGGSFGPDEDHLDLIPYRRGSDLMDEVPPLLTGDTDPLAFPGGYETDGRIWLVCDQPLPFTLVALFPRLESD